MRVTACAIQTAIRITVEGFFDQDLLHTPHCELRQDGRHVMFITSNTSVVPTEYEDFNPRANHTEIVCPICSESLYHITYEIPASTFINLSNCSNGSSDGM